MSDQHGRGADGRAVRASGVRPSSRPGAPPAGPAAGDDSGPGAEWPPAVAPPPEPPTEPVPPGPEDAGSLGRELAERNDQLLRLAADFENFRRRKAQEIADRSRYASEDAALALLPVLDNLRRAVAHLPAEGDGQQLQDGLRMVVVQFEQALSSIGVEPVDTVGARFDPAVHEAIGGEESDEVSEDTVVAELQPGYRLHDRLLRPALVRVAHPRTGGGAAAG